MSPTKTSTSSDEKVYRVPLWMLSILKVAWPALLLAVGVYYKVSMLETQAIKHEETIELHSTEINGLSTTTKLMEQAEKNNNRLIMQSLDGIQKGLDETKQEIKEQKTEQRHSMEQIQKDFRQLQMRLPRKDPS